MIRDAFGRVLPTEEKKRECAFCRQSYTAVFPEQRVCSWSCATRKARVDQARDAERLRVLK